MNDQDIATAQIRTIRRAIDERRDMITRTGMTLDRFDKAKIYLLDRMAVSAGDGTVTISLAAHRMPAHIARDADHVVRWVLDEVEGEVSQTARLTWTLTY